MKVKALDNISYSLNGYEVLKASKGEVVDLPDADAERMIKHKFFARETKAVKPKKETKVEKQSNDSAND